MKIAHIQQPYIPKMGYQENNLPHVQQQLGHEVTIFTTTAIPPHRGPDNQKQYPPGDYDYEGVRTVRFPALFRMPATSDAFPRGLLRGLYRYSPDIIHCHGTIQLHLVQTLLYSKLTATPLVVDDHMDENNFSLSTLTNKIGFGIYKRTLLPVLKSTAEHFLPIQKYSKRILVENLNIPEESISLLPLGVDPDEFYPDEQLGAETRESLDVGDEEFLIVTAGHLEPEKNIELVIQAVGQLVSEGYPVRLVIVGSGTNEYLDQLRDIVKEWDIEAAVTFHGFADHDELVAHYNAADVGVWPGIGVSINEAISTGLPIVIANYEATSHLVSAENGFTFTPGDCEDLTKTLQQYLEHPQSQEDHSAAALDFVQKELSWSAIGERSIEVYREALSE